METETKERNRDEHSAGRMFKEAHVGSFVFEEKQWKNHTPVSQSAYFVICMMMALAFLSIGIIFVGERSFYD